MPTGRSGGTWSRLDPSTEWLEDEHEPATVPYERRAAEEPDATPTAISAAYTDDAAVLMEEPMRDDDGHVIGYLRSIDANMQREADASVESVAMLRSVGEWARFIFFGVCAALGIGGFLALGTLSVFLLAKEF
jgi:hypothetical protein